MRPEEQTNSDQMMAPQMENEGIRNIQSGKIAPTDGM